LIEFVDADDRRVSFRMTEVTGFGERGNGVAVWLRGGREHVLRCDYPEFAELWSKITRAAILVAHKQNKNE